MATARVAQQSTTTTEQDTAGAAPQRLGECPRNTILHGHAIAVLRTLPDACVQTVVTSPPYFGLRSYDTEPQIWDGEDPLCEHIWVEARYYREGGNSTRSALAFSEPGPENAARIKATRWRTNVVCDLCGAWRGELGSEPTIDLYVAHIVQVFREIRRVLRDDGTCWLNLGDSYATRSVQRDDGMRSVIKDYAGEAELPSWSEYAARGRARYSSSLKTAGLKDKDLIGIPWRVALALQADGWWLRSEIIWHKANVMPESVTDRPTRSHEQIFLLAKAQRYHYDAAAIMEPVTGNTHSRGKGVFRKMAPAKQGIKANESWSLATTGIVSSRNKRTVWKVPARAFADAHFATFPPALIEPCVLAGTSPRVCESCGAPWQRNTAKATRFEGGSGKAGRTAEDANAQGKWAGKQHGKNIKLGPVVSVTTTGWRPTCCCPAEHNTGRGKSIVLDPFMGSGTVGVVARRHSREYLGIELQPDYIAMAERRIATERQPHLWTA